MTSLLLLVCLLAHSSMGAVFISEIMYRSRNNNERLEYVELYNDADTEVDISNLVIYGIAFTFDYGTIFPPKSYLVVAKDPLTLKRVYNLSTVPYGPYKDSLADDGGELLRLISTSSSVVRDALRYGRSFPWPPLANGFGPSLELACYERPSKPYYWVSSPLPASVNQNAEYSGTPGSAPVWSFCPSRAPEPQKLLFSEIMYSTVGKMAIDELHEYIEIYNPGNLEVNLTNWRIVASSRMAYDFPAGTTIAPGQFIIIAKDVTEFKKIYPNATGIILGPYAGELGNKQTGVAIVDDNGLVSDFLEYDITNGWPAAANSLGGAMEDLHSFNPFKATYNSYKFSGRSLSRRFWSWPTDAAYNWRDADPSPGISNIDSSTLPQLSSSWKPSDYFMIPSTSAVVTASLLPAPSSERSVSRVTLNWAIQDVINGKPLRFRTVIMNPKPNSTGFYSYEIPPLEANTIVRFYVKAVVDNVTLRFPPLTSPFLYSSYFVDPNSLLIDLPSKTTTSVKTPTYSLFINRNDWGRMFSNIKTNTSKSTYRTLDSCTENELWDQRVPAVLTYYNELFDVTLRYHPKAADLSYPKFMRNWPGNKYVGPLPDPTIPDLAWDIRIPSYQDVEGHRNIRLEKFNACDMKSHAITSLLFEQFGLPSTGGNLFFVSGAMAVNGFYYRDMILTAQDFGQLLADRTTEQCLDHNPMKVPHVFAVRGREKNEAGWGPGNFSPLADRCGNRWPARKRYEYTYERLTHNDWANSDYLKSTIEDNWALFNANPASPSGKASLTKMFDTNFLLSYYMLTSWGAEPNNFYEDQYLIYREEDKKWFMAGVNPEKMFSFRSPTTKPVMNRNNYNFTILEQNINKYMKPELIDRFNLMVNEFSDTWLTGPNFFEGPVSIYDFYDPRNLQHLDQSCNENVDDFFRRRRSDYISQNNLKDNAKFELLKQIEEIRCPDQPTITRTYNNWKVVPGKPQEVTFKIQNSSMIELLWLPPNSWTSPIQHYIVTYTPIQQSTITVQVPAKDLTFTLTNPGVDIIDFTITAVSELGPGVTTTTRVTIDPPTDSILVVTKL